MKSGSQKKKLIVGVSIWLIIAVFMAHFPVAFLLEQYDESEVLVYEGKVKLLKCDYYNTKLKRKSFVEF